MFDTLCHLTALSFSTAASHCEAARSAVTRSHAQVVKSCYVKRPFYQSFPNILSASFPWPVDLLQLAKCSTVAFSMRLQLLNGSLNEIILRAISGTARSKKRQNQTDAGMV